MKEGEGEKGVSTINRKEVLGITIDPQGSKDLDDAFHLRKTEKGWLLQISIADPTSGVPIGSESDDVARSRGFTRYFPKCNAPMLSRKISEKRYSLLEGQERPVITISIDFSEDLEIHGFDVARMYLKSSHRLSYEDVDRIISDGGHELCVFMSECYALAQALLVRRRRKGALAFYDFNSGWMTNEDGILVRMQSKDAHFGHVIVQEFMILANELVASFCAERDIPVIFRNHSVKSVAPERGELISEICQAIENSDKIPVENIKKRIGLLMNRAVYEPVVRGHYGLNLPVYVHFTSPLRRYPDLINHRIIVAFLEGESIPYSLEDLKKIARHCTTVEHEIKDKVREAYKKKACVEAEKKILTGEISSLSPDEFCHVLGSVLCDKPTAEFEAEIERRLDASILSIRDMYRILFVANQDWLRIKDRILSYVVSFPHISISILNSASNISGWGRTYFDTEKLELGGSVQFTSIARVIINDRQFVSRPYNSYKKKRSEQSAATDLIRAIVNSGLEMEIEGSSKDLLTKKIISVQEDFKGELWNVCSRNGWGFPVFKTEKRGLDHAPLFATVAEVSIDGFEYASVAKVAKKKTKSEHLASADLLDKIRHLMKDRFKPDSPISSNYVGALYELCRARGYDSPCFSSQVKAGPGNMPIVVIGCTLQAGENVVEFKIEARSGKIAKQEVSRLILEQLQKSD